MADDKIIYEIRENVSEIKATLKSIVENTDLKFQIYEEKIKVANKRIEKLENSNTWLWRTTAGAVISAVVVLLTNLK